MCPGSCRIERSCSRAGRVMANTTTKLDNITTNLLERNACFCFMNLVSASMMWYLDWQLLSRTEQPDLATTIPCHRSGRERMWPAKCAGLANQQKRLRLAIAVARIRRCRGLACSRPVCHWQIPTSGRQHNGGHRSKRCDGTHRGEFSDAAILIDAPQICQHFLGMELAPRRAL